MTKLLALIDALPFRSYGIAISAAIVAVYTPWPLSVTMLLGGIFLGIAHKTFLHEEQKMARSVKVFLLISGFTILIMSAIGPLFRPAEMYFGYDVGFYKHYLEQPTTTFPRPSALLLPDSAIGARMFLDILSLSGLPSDFILYGSLATLFICTGLLLFLLTRKKFNTTTASIILILFALSFAQVTAYQLFLWKQIFALALLVLVFLALHKKSFWIILPALLIFISHRTTSVFLFLSVLPTLWFLYPKYRRWLILAFLPVTIGLLWWQREVFFILERIIILGSSAPDYFAVREGQFMSIDTYLTLNALLLPLAVAGIFYDKERLKQPFFWLGLASLLFVVFQLPFYKRVLIFLDLSIIFYAGSALGKIIVRSKKSITRYLCFMILFVLVLFWLWALYSRPNTITKSFLQPIRNLQTLDQSRPVLVVSSYDAPWVWGWSGHDVIAPGLFQDKWNYDEWFTFWTTSNPTERQELMNRYPVAPYVYVSSENLLATPLDPQCFHQLNQFVYEYVCSVQNK